MSIEDSFIPKQEKIAVTDRRMYEPDEFDARKEQFDAGLREKGAEGDNKLKELYKDVRFARTMIIRRGPDSVHHKEFITGLNKLVASENDPDRVFDVESGENLIEFVHEHDLPEDVMAKMHEIYTHQRDIGRLDKMSELLNAHRGSLEDKSIYYRLMHDEATIDREEDESQEEAMNKNDIIVKETRDSEDERVKMISAKASVGTIWNNPNISDGKRAELLFTKADVMKNLGSSEEMRVRAAVANFLADHAEKQYQDKDAQIETVDKAIEMAVPLRADGNKLGYSTVEINALEALVRLNNMKYLRETGANVAKRGMTKEAKMARDYVRRFGKQAIALRRSVHYATNKQNNKKIEEILKNIR